MNRLNLGFRTGFYLGFRTGFCIGSINYYILVYNYGSKQLILILNKPVLATFMLLMEAFESYKKGFEISDIKLMSFLINL